MQKTKSTPHEYQAIGPPQASIRPQDADAKACEACYKKELEVPVLWAGWRARAVHAGRPASRVKGTKGRPTARAEWRLEGKSTLKVRPTWTSQGPRPTCRS